MRISDWSSDVCSSDLSDPVAPALPGGRHLIVRRVTPATAMAGGDCDILFLGRMPPGDRQRLIGWVRGRAVLTVTDDDPACLYGALVCLARKPDGHRSTVHPHAIGRTPPPLTPPPLQPGPCSQRSPCPPVFSLPPPPTPSPPP